MSLPITEQENPKTENIDRLPVPEALRLINAEDKLVAVAVEEAIPEIAGFIELTAERMRQGGRLFYIGTGTSGRLGVLDASEIPPTYGVSSDLIQGVIAGGFEALYRATESSEDDRESGKKDLTERGLNNQDTVIGIAASGRTPYTIGAVEYAGGIGCLTACITCNPASPITKSVRIPIVAVVGPEAITGSTRMKAGTAQKMILNMISTALMIKLGYVKGNLMTNLKPKNEKLRERSRRILMRELGLTEKAAAELFTKAGEDLRIALVIGKTNVSYDQAASELRKSNGVIEKTIDAINSKKQTDL